MFDFFSYIFGKKKGYKEGRDDGLEEGKSTVVLESTAYTFTDTGNGNIVIAEKEGD